MRPGSLVRMVAWNDAFVARLQGFAMLTVSCIRPPVAPAEVSWRLSLTSGVLRGRRCRERAEGRQPAAASRGRPKLGYALAGGAAIAAENAEAR